jgi:hypothetical protein
MDQLIEALDLQQEIKKIIKKGKDAVTPSDLCIHDGVLDKLVVCSTSIMLSMLNTAVGNGLIRKVTHVTSLAFRLSTGGQLLNSRLSTIRDPSFDSWRKEDYGAAVSCKAFMEELKKSAINPFPMDMCFLLANTAMDDAEDTAEEKESMSSSDTHMDHDNTKGNTTLSDQKVVEAKYF